MTDRTDQAHAGALLELCTGTVADILDELGARHQCLPAGIRPLTPQTMLKVVEVIGSAGA